MKARINSPVDAYEVGFAKAKPLAYAYEDDFSYEKSVDAYEVGFAKAKPLAYAYEDDFSYEKS